MEKCTLCPYNCNIDREKKLGMCKSNAKVKIALASLHLYEEPCISGKNGSGTIFFSNCNLKCVYCQNYEISQENKGNEITVEHLAEIFINQQGKGAHNINLVSPTPYVNDIIKAIDIAKNKGLNIPIVYNTSGYEKIETLKKLENYIDIYLPDFKYMNNDLAIEYSNAKNYKEIATNAIKEMYRQVGAPIFDDNGLIKRGLIIRHLILPNAVKNSKQVLKWIEKNLDNNVYVSVMAQYFPCFKAKNIKMLNRKLTRAEYEEVEQFLYSLNLENGYIQELGEHEEEYVPNFDFSE